MKKEYNFSQSKKNPYAKHFKKQISIRIDLETIDYFKNLAEETGITYQNLINLFLKDCAKFKKKLNLRWKGAS
ncbi:MAG TPA: BrnA antitoxin family protein [Bdellovibrionota bacterium]|nr:BrnA antitoxin family protein [Bdellovibrionota bacterium]